MANWSNWKSMDAVDISDPSRPSDGDIRIDRNSGKHYQWDEDHWQEINVDTGQPVGIPLSIIGLAK